MKIIFSGGGTGGHIYPAIALIKALKKEDKDVDILYIGKIKAKEETICEQENIPFNGIKIRCFYRKLIYKNLLTLYEFFKAYKKVKNIIKEFQPDIIIGMGGYVCAPVVYAGNKLKIKTIIHEQNSVPGLTIKFLSKYADSIAISFLSSQKYFPDEKVVLTGNPRAQEVVETKFMDKTNLGLNPNKRLILIFCGSLGAKYVNQTIVKTLPLLSKRKDIEVIFVTGESHYDTIISELGNKNDNILIKSYINQMPAYLKISDLVICRAGATSLAEITAIGIPAILIPSPYVTNNHQEKNALDLVRIGAAIMIKEKDLNEIQLFHIIRDLLNKPEKLQLFRINSKKLGIIDANDLFISLIRQLV